MKNGYLLQFASTSFNFILFLPAHILSCLKYGRSFDSMESRSADSVLRHSWLKTLDLWLLEMVCGARRRSEKGRWIEAMPKRTFSHPGRWEAGSLVMRRRGSLGTYLAGANLCRMDLRALNEAVSNFRAIQMKIPEYDRALMVLSAGKDEIRGSPPAGWA
jgi:hypothetical protein